MPMAKDCTRSKRAFGWLVLMGPIFILLLSAGTIEQRGDGERLVHFFRYGMSIEEFSQPAGAQRKAVPPSSSGRCEIVKRWLPWIGGSGSDALAEGTFIDGGLISVRIMSRHIEGWRFIDYLNNRFDKAESGWIIPPQFEYRTGPGSRFDALFNWKWQRNGVIASVRLTEFVRKGYGDIADMTVAFEEEYRRADESIYDRCYGKRQADQSE